MKQFRSFAFATLLTLIHVQGFAQVTSIPKEAMDNFQAQYPLAEQVEWDNDIVHVNVRFRLNGEKMNAEYSNKGLWRHTMQDYSFEKLDTAIREGFSKSKFAEWEVTDVKKIYYPGNVEQYRLRAEKNDVQKKYLYFNKAGRLLRDSITL